MKPSATHQRSTFWITLLFAAIALAVYWLTAHRTITWWIGSSCPSAAACLGVGHPPGSLILTILGWVVSKLPLGITKILSLNLFAGAIAAATVGTTIALARGLISDGYDRRTFQSVGTPPILVTSVAGLVVLAMAFGETMWRYSIKFQPYVLTALFTTFLLWAMLNWWRQAKDRDGWRWIFVTMLLFGLDISVHRTNMILLPGLLVWILLRYPGAFKQLKVWMGGIAGTVLGASFHLIIMLMAKADPPLNANDPSNWSRFYDYVSLKQYGGGWLVNLFPRKAPFFEVQLKNYVSYFSDNFAYVADSWGVMAVLPLLLGVVGLFLLVVRYRRLAIGLFVFFLLASIGEVFYFNTPGEFFWPMDRHYLSSFVLFTLFAAYGAGQIALYLWARSGAVRAISLSVLIVVLTAASAIQIGHNYSALNSARKTFAFDYAMNVFNTLERNAILFMQGDNYWPFCYLQIAEEVRPDVVVMSTNLTNTSWYVHQLKRQHPLLPISLSDEEIDQLSAKAWKDTTIAIEVLATPDIYGMPEKTIFPDSAYLRVTPTLADRYVLPQDWFLLHLLKNNRYRRPVYFDIPPQWLNSMSRSDGLVWCAVPSESAANDYETLTDNLLNEYVYNGYDDETVRLDPITVKIAGELQRSFVGLAYQQMANEDTAKVCQTLEAMEEFLPSGRIPLPESLVTAVEQLKESADCR